MPRSDASHWQAVYTESSAGTASWHEPEPSRSLELVEAADLPKDAAILDVGGGTSRLAARLADRGYTDLTVADISTEGLELAQAQLQRPEQVTWIEADLRDHDFGRTYDLWHDRAVFHFMVAEADRDGYIDLLHRTLRPGGHAILATFGPDGPERCSGLPTRRYDSESLSVLLGPGFELLGSSLDIHHTPAGSEQQFLYAHFRCR